MSYLTTLRRSWRESTQFKPALIVGFCIAVSCWVTIVAGPKLDKLEFWCYVVIFMWGTAGLMAIASDGGLGPRSPYIRLNKRPLVLPFVGTATSLMLYGWLAKTTPLSTLIVLAACLSVIGATLAGYLSYRCQQTAVYASAIRL